MQITMRSPLLLNPRLRVQRLWTNLGNLPRLATTVIMLVLLSALGANVLAGSVLPEASQIDLRFRYAPPWPLTASSSAHLLGTDRLGRDVLRTTMTSPVWRGGTCCFYI